MSAEKLAFLQYFYTDVTLYVPEEKPLPNPPVKPAAASPAEIPPAKRPSASAVLPSRSYSQPSAGLERLASGFTPPMVGIVEPEPLLPVPAADTPVRQAPMPAVVQLPVQPTA